MQLSLRSWTSALPALGCVILLVVASQLLSACGPPQSRPPALRITALPDSKTTELDPKYRLVASHLSEVLGVEVEYVAVTDYAASVEAFKNGDVQLAWFGGVSGVQARAAVPGARAIAFGTIDPQFRSYFVAHQGAGLAPRAEFPMELAGKRFTFGDAASTSGRVMPEHFLREITGKTPEEFFGEVNLNGGKHAIVAKNVEQGVYDAGVLNFQTYENMVDAGELDPELCLKIWETPPYADYNWTAHPDVDFKFGKGFTDRLQEALTSITDPVLLDALQRPDGLIAAQNSDFDRIEAICRELGIIGR
ncbi:Phosphate-import protein PhnD precursor [Planctomycetes bacterium Poly30]|uniref:Phosphate-import protein PhnD n=1 Tax=Saltatorellus ferox TaxID=2528018 RepID=A0A518ETW8_9BACT|nr:Phosphate-import protein PhnD precursor [Planctomycetes bacterium Poly30]